MNAFIRFSCKKLSGVLLASSLNLKFKLYVIKLSKLWNPNVDQKLKPILNDILHLYSGKNVLVKISDTGVVQIYSNEWVTFYSGGQKSFCSLCDSHNNYLRLSSSNAHKLVAYDFFKNEKDVYQVERLSSLSFDELSNAKSYVLDFFKKYGFTKKRSIKFQVFSDFFYEKLMMDILFLEKKFDIANYNYISGLSHGDLTPHNIMCNSKREYVLIDLDRVSFDRDLLFDHIHFDIEASVMLGNTNWLKVLKSKFHKLNQNGLILTTESKSLVHYFLTRLYLEFGGDVKAKPVASYKRKIECFILFLKGV